MLPVFPEFKYCFALVFSTIGMAKQAQCHHHWWPLLFLSQTPALASVYEYMYNASSHKKVVAQIPSPKKTECFHENLKGDLFIY